jgi:hypothetical protein
LRVVSAFTVATALHTSSSATAMCLHSTILLPQPVKKCQRGPDSALWLNQRAARCAVSMWRRGLRWLCCVGGAGALCLCREDCKSLERGALYLGLAQHRATC